MLDVIVDLSHHNAVTDFSAAKTKSGILGVIHKATEGINFSDPTYESRRAQALAAGLLWGAYHFGTGEASGAAQAAYFLAVVKPEHHDLLVLDFEENPDGTSMSLAQAEEFVTYVQEHTNPQRWPGLYGGYYLKQLLGNAKNAMLANCWLWLADWAPRAIVPANWSTWTIWQYADQSKGANIVAGIGNCDRDRFNGDVAGLHTFWGQST